MLATFTFSGILVWCYVDFQLFKLPVSFICIVKETFILFVFVYVGGGHVCVFPWKPGQQIPWSCSYTWAVSFLVWILGIKLGSRSRAASNLHAEPSLHLYFKISNLSLFFLKKFQVTISTCLVVGTWVHMSLVPTFFLYR